MDTSTTSSATSSATPSRRGSMNGSNAEATSHPLDVMARQYPKPEREVSVAEALARQPGKWTLSYWINDAATRPSMPLRTSSKEQFEQAKKELREAHAQLNQR